MSRRIIIQLCGILSGLFCLLLPFNMQQARAEDPAPILVGMSAAFTGPSRSLGIELYRGSMAYFNYVNRNGGIHGRPITIKALDDGYNPAPAVHNTIELIEKHDVLLLFDYVGTPTVTRVLPLLKLYSEMPVLLFFPFTGAQPHRKFPYSRYVYNFRASYRTETKELVEKLMELGKQRIAIFYQADAYGRSGWDGVRRALQEYSLDMVGEATYHRNVSFRDSMLEQVSILNATVPDAVICIGSYEASAAFIRDARDFGLDIPIANISFAGSDSILSLLRNESSRTGRDYFSNLINTQVVPSYEDIALPGVREYRRIMDDYAPPPPTDLVETNYTPVRYGFVSFEGFINARLLVQALQSLDHVPHREELREAMSAVNCTILGIGDDFSFGAPRDAQEAKVYFTTCRNGRFVPVRKWSELK